MEYSEIQFNLIGSIFPEANVLAKASQLSYGYGENNYVIELCKNGISCLWNVHDKWEDGRIVIYVLSDLKSMPSRAIISIKGSENPTSFFSSTLTRKDWIRNIIGKIYPNPWNKAFASCVKGVTELVKRNKRYNFAYFVTGHSAGGTLAQDISRKFNIPGASFCALGVKNRSLFETDNEEIYLYHSAHSRFYNHIIRGEIAWIESFCDSNNYFGNIIIHEPRGSGEKNESNPIKLHLIDHFIQHHFNPREGGKPCTNDLCIWKH